MGWPSYEFTFYIAPPRRWFAWFPVKTYDGEWAWLRRVLRRRRQTLPFLDGPCITSWTYMREGDE